MTTKTIVTPKPQGHGAVKGGNICLLIACLAIAAIPLVGWVIAGPLILVNFILAIVAMSQNQTKNGIMMLLGSFVCPVIAQVIGLALWASHLTPQTTAPPDVKIDIEAAGTKATPAPTLTAMPATVTAMPPKAAATPKAKKTTTSLEAKCRAIAKREYPNDFAMQKFIYEMQLEAARYMLKVADPNVKTIALREYPEDFAMQKFIYDMQSEAKAAMKSLD
jgi:hypothetical protein